MAPGEKLQVVFLMNTKAPSNVSLERHYKAQCLACTRILMSRFLNKEHSQIQWNYKFFSSETPAKSLEVNTAEFYEVRSELLEHFFCQLLAYLKETPGQDRVLRQRNCGAKCVYNALAATVQDFIWDAPEIKSPVRPKAQHRLTRQRGTMNSTTSSQFPSRNIIFLFSEAPINSGTNEEEGSQDLSSTALINQVFPKPLLSQLLLKGISVHWVHSGVERDAPLLKGFPDAFRAVGGSIVPLSGLLEPVSRSIIIPKLLSGQSIKATVDRRKLFWLCSKDGGIICVLQLRETRSRLYREVVSSTKSHHAGQPNASLVDHLQARKEAQACLQLPTEGSEVGTRSRKIVLAMGLVRKAAISLHLFDFSATCSCSSFGVSDETRAKRLDVDASLPRERRSSFSPPTVPVPGTSGGSNFHKSPQIHLYKSQASCSTSRRRSASVPDLFRGARMAGSSIDLQHERSAGTRQPGHSLESPVEGTTTQRSLLTSSSEQMQDPCESLVLSLGEPVPSDQYRNLCSILTSSKSLLLVKVMADLEGKGEESGEAVRWAFLQPVISVVSSLSFIKPCHYRRLESLLAQSQGLASSVPPPDRTLEEERSSPLSSPSDLPRPQEHAPPPFSFCSLSPWFPYAQTCAVQSSVFQQLQELQVRSQESRYGALERRRNLVSQLREFYSASKEDLGSASAEEEEEDMERGEEESGVRQEVGVEPPELSEGELWEQLRASYQEQLSAVEVDMLHRWVTESLQLLLRCLQRATGVGPLNPSDSPHQQATGIGPCGPSASPLQRDAPHDPSSSPLRQEAKIGPCNLSDSPPTAIGPPLQREAEIGAQDLSSPPLQPTAGISPHEPSCPPLQQATKIGQCDHYLRQFWDQMNSNLLLSSVELAEKYNPEIYPPVETEMKVNEYLLQALLRFESVSLCEEVIADHAAIAAELIALLRKVTHFSDPRVLGRFILTVILPTYFTSCRELVKDVCEGLMFQLPPDIEGSPLASSSPVVEDWEGGQMEVGLISPERPLAPRFPKPAAKRLARHQSFQEVSNRRLITIPRKKAMKQGPKHSREIVVHRSVRRPFKTESPSKRRKSVCRSLFSRSHTVGDFGSKRKEGGKGRGEGKGVMHSESGRKRRKGPSVLVKETPLKLQCSKMNMVSESPGVKTIKESPRRSFYSDCRRRVITPNFKTPPVSRRVFLPLNKDPSPSTIHSLLHDNFASPWQGPPLAAAVNTSPLVATVNTAASVPLTMVPASPLVAETAATVSPDLFDGPRLQPPADMLSSEELFKVNCELEREPQPRRSECHHGYKSARMLTYGEREDPLVPSNQPAKLQPANPLRLLVRTKTPTKSVRALLRPTRMLITCVTPTKSYTRTPSTSPALDLETVARTQTEAITRTPVRTLVANRPQDPLVRTLLEANRSEELPMESSRTPLSFRTSSKPSTTPPTTSRTTAKTPLKSARTPPKSSRTPLKSARTPTKLRSLLGAWKLGNREAGTPIRTPTTSYRTPTKSSRMLMSSRTPKSSRTPTKSVNIPTQTKLRSLTRPSSSCKKSNSSSCKITGITTLACSLPTTPTKALDRVFLFSSPSTGGEDSEEDAFGCSHTDPVLVVGLDPLLHDSASMTAFALSTPTKDDPHDFSQAFSRLHDGGNNTNSD